MTGTIPRPDGGFTLLELLVSLVLLSLLMSLVPPALRLAQRGPAIAAELDRRAEIDAALSFSVQQLGEATPIYLRGDDGRLQIQFDGKPEAIGFVAPAKFDSADSGLTRFDLALGSDAAGRHGLLLSWTAWRSASRYGTDPKNGAPAVSQSKLLIEGATDFRLRYFGSVRSRGEKDWSTSWPRTDALPALVEMSVTTAKETRRRIVTLHLDLP